MVELGNICAFLIENEGVLVQEGTFSQTHLISGPRNGDDANEQQFTFFNLKAGDAVYAKIAVCQAALILLENKLDQQRMILPINATVFLCADAKKAMMDCARHFFLPEPASLIHPAAHISHSAIIGHHANIAAGVVISDNVLIGDNCVIEPNVYIHAHTQIGNRVHIKANTVIGGDGFGYVKNETGAYDHVPHFGKVCIEDDVHIGSNTCIDRGSLSDTIIKKGVKIDNLVHIAHNVEIGENTLVIACSMIAGSVRIGENAWIAPAASIKNGITIGDNVIVGMSSLVLKSVADGLTVAGIPAKELGK